MEYTEDDIIDLELDALLSMKDLRSYLPVSHTQINRMVASGQIPPPLYIGIRPFWMRSRVRRWLGHLANGCSAQEAVQRIA